MSNENYRENKSVLEKILDHKGIIFITAGIIIRILMLLYYYYKLPSNNPDLWGDLGKNFDGAFYYPPFTMFLLDAFRVISLDMIIIFAFWAFLLDIIVMFLFYFVLKSFEIRNWKYVFGLFFINPFFFLNNVFSLEKCGYHITDSFFFILLFLALTFYPRDKEWSKYLFYIFLALSAVAKMYTLPIIGFFFLKFLIEKDWDEMKKFLICTVPIVFVFLVLPIFYIENYINLYLLWNEAGEVLLPLYIRLIIVGIISIAYIFFRLKKAGIIEITFFSILVMAFFLFFSVPYIRYFQPLLIYGILTPYVFFTFTLNLGIIKRKIVFDNHLFVFYLSFILVGVAALIIFFVL